MDKTVDKGSLLRLKKIISENRHINITNTFLRYVSYLKKKINEWYFRLNDQALTKGFYI